VKADNHGAGAGRFVAGGLGGVNVGDDAGFLFYKAVTQPGCNQSACNCCQQINSKQNKFMLLQ
jgi:hypothetical protein